MRRERLSLLVLCGGVVLALLYGLWRNGAAQGAIYHVLGALVVAALAVGIRRRRPAEPAVWWLIDAGFAATVAAGFLRGTAADALSLGGYGLILVALVRLNRCVLRDATPQILDGTVLGLAVASVLFVFVVGPIRDAGGPTSASLVTAAYPAADALFVIAVMPLVLARPQNAALRLMMACIGFTFVADVLYNTQLLHGTYVKGGWTDVGWLVAFACAAAAALSPSFAQAATPLPRSHGEAWSELGLVAVATCTSIGVFASVTPSWDDEYVVPAVLCTLTMLLVFARVARIHRERQRTLSEYVAESERLAAVEEVQRHVTEGELGIDALLELVCARTVGLLGHSAAVIVHENGELTVRAKGGPAPLPAGTKIGAHSLAATAIAEDAVLIADDAELDERVNHATASAAGIASIVAAPLHFGGAAIGSLAAVADVPRAFSRRDARTLQLMASLLSVAVSRSSEFAARRALADIVDASGDAIVNETLDGTIVAWNAGAERMYGYTEEEMVGSSIERIVPADLRQELGLFYAELARGASIAPFETERVRKDGTRIAVSLGLSPVRDASGRVVGAFALARDITARRELEEQLHRAQKLEAVGRLAGGVAHDFNNLLLAIEGYGSLLLARLADSTQREYAERILAAAQRSAELTQQLLAYSRKQTLQPQIVQANGIVDEMVRMLTRVIGEDIVLDCRLGEDVGHVLVDPSRLGQVVMNLGVNARDAMPDGGRLTIETESVELYAADAARAGGAPPGRYVCLRVTDTGIGMDEETLSRIFEPFFTTKEEGHGTGLGLATVFGTVSQSGGYITVESRLGAGTTFSVYLPEQAAALEAVESPACREEGGTERILVVDDQEAVRSLLVEILSTAGYRVLAVGDGNEALRHLERADLLVTDLVMPGMNGVELARLARERCPSLPVLLTSGHAGRGLADQIDQSEVTVLPKPYLADELRIAVRAALDAALPAAA